MSGRRKVCCWHAAIIILASSAAALAFSSSSSALNTNNIIRATKSRLFTASPNANEEVENIPIVANDNIDSEVRRRLVLSLLATVSAASFAAHASAATTTSSSSSSVVVDTSPTTNAEIINVLKPPLDQRNYEAYELPNGLKVLLCSDPTSLSAAVGMNVHVGSLGNPVTVPGLAHFCEHMLFLGTAKYPVEDSFAKFLSANGGFNNAFTDSENTVYFFEMDGSADNRFAEALLRFGSFFSCPLFTESATGRELNAIESENAKNLQSDVFRLYELEKSRVNSDHPYSKFFTGNKKTLLEDTKRQGINLRNELVKFYETFYSSNQMALAVVAPQSLPQLRKFVLDAFGDIPNRQINRPEDKWAFKINPYVAGKSVIPAEKTILEIVPIQELRQVTITWPIVFSSKEERELFRLNKPDYFVAWLLGHEGAGSLLSYLKEKRWANALGASDNADLADFVTFEVTVELTNKGLDAIDDVCEAIFSYVKMLSQNPIPNYVFDENLQLDELEWRYTTKGKPGNYVQSLVTAMDKFPSSLYIAGPRRLALLETPSTLISSNKPRTSFKSNEQRQILKEACTEFVSKLTVENSFLTAFSKTFEGKTTETEQWYGTAYTVKPIPSSTLSRWKNPGSFPLFYPRKNVFIPSESGLRVNKTPKSVDQAKSFEEKMKPIPPPTIIRDDGDEGRWTVHFKEDDRFGKPKAFLIFQLLTDELYSSPTKAVLGMLYQQCAGDKMNEDTYDARLAGLSYDCQVLPRGVRLTFGGYNDKLKAFASFVTSKLARNLDDVLPKDDEEFERYKDNLLRSLSAFKVKEPYGHAIYYSSLTQQPRNFIYPNDQLLAALQETTRSQLVDYVSTLWASGKGEALIQGNFHKTEALDVVSSIDKTLAFKTISSAQYPGRLKALPLPSIGSDRAVTKLLISEPNPNAVNAASQITLQCLNTSEKDHVLIELISAIIKEPFFDDLRTKQQLGYIVSSGVKGVDQSRTLSAIVQSNVAPSERLTSAMMTFLDGVRDKLLLPLNSADIELYVKGLIDRRLEPDKQLAIEVTRNWSEIASGRLQFDRLQAEVAALLDINKEDILDYWDELYNSDSSRILVTEIVPRTGQASSKEPSLSGVGIKHILGINDIELLRASGEMRLSAS